MDEPRDLRTRLVMTDTSDERGTMWRAVRLTEDGGLVVEGHDRGAGVEHIFGSREYEFERHLSASEVSTLRRLLHITESDDLLTAIERRFQSTHELETFVSDHDIPGEFWSRIGD